MCARRSGSPEGAGAPGRAGGGAGGVLDGDPGRRVVEVDGMADADPPQAVGLGARRSRRACPDKATTSSAPAAPRNLRARLQGGRWLARDAPGALAPTRLPSPTEGLSRAPTRTRHFSR